MMRFEKIAALITLLGIAVAVAPPAPAHGADEAKMIVVNPQAMKFIQIPNMPPCASAAILRGDPRSGPAWVLLKLASGCRVPAHWHTPTEEMVVINGQGSITMQDGPPLRFAPGAYASLPSHHVHQANCTRTCLFFNSADGPFDIHYVDASGSEISLDKAMKQSPTTKARKKK